MKAYLAKKLTVNLEKNTQRYRIPRKKIKYVAQHVLAACGKKRAEITIIVSSNAFIKKLNKVYKKRNANTDVLAFPFSYIGAGLSRSERCFLGDIIISLDQTCINARKFRTSFTDELLLYVIHGVLHILGYNDIKPNDRRIMERKQTQYFNQFVKKCK